MVCLCIRCITVIVFFQSLSLSWITVPKTLTKNNTNDLIFYLKAFFWIKHIKIKASAFVGNDWVSPKTLSVQWRPLSLFVQRRPLSLKKSLWHRILNFCSHIFLRCYKINFSKWLIFFSILNGWCHLMTHPNSTAYVCSKNFCILWLTLWEKTRRRDHTWEFSLFRKILGLKRNLKCRTL